MAPYLLLLRDLLRRLSPWRSTSRRDLCQRATESESVLSHLKGLMLVSVKKAGDRHDFSHNGA